MRMLEHPVASDVIPFPLWSHILSHPSEHVSVVDSCGLEQRYEIIRTKMPIRTSMRLAASGRMLGQDLLAREGGVTPASSYRIAADVAIRMAHIVLVLLVEFIVGFLLEACAPEDQAVFEGQANALEKERVLQSAIVFQMVILT